MKKYFLLIIYCLSMSLNAPLLGSVDNSITYGSWCGLATSVGALTYGVHELHSIKKHNQQASDTTYKKYHCLIASGICGSIAFGLSATGVMTREKSTIAGILLYMTGLGAYTYADAQETIRLSQEKIDAMAQKNREKVAQERLKTEQMKAEFEQKLAISTAIINDLTYQRDNHHKTLISKFLANNAKHQHRLPHGMISEKLEIHRKNREEFAALKVTLAQEQENKANIQLEYEYQCKQAGWRECLTSLDASDEYFQQKINNQKVLKKTITEKAHFMKLMALMGTFIIAPEMIFYFYSHCTWLKKWGLKIAWHPH